MKKKMEYDPKVSLFLVPTAIANRGKKRGGKLLRISVVQDEEQRHLIKYWCQTVDANHPGILHTFPLHAETPITGRGRVS